MRRPEASNYSHPKTIVTFVTATKENNKENIYEKNKHLLFFRFKFCQYKLNKNNLHKLFEIYYIKYIFNQNIKNMYYNSHDNDSYYIKDGSFGDTIYKLSIETPNINKIFIEFNNKKINISNIDELKIIKELFNFFKRY